MPTWDNSPVVSSRSNGFDSEAEEDIATRVKLFIQSTISRDDTLGKKSKEDELLATLASQLQSQRKKSINFNYLFLCEGTLLTEYTQFCNH